MEVSMVNKMFDFDTGESVSCFPSPVSYQQPTLVPFNHFNHKIWVDDPKDTLLFVWKWSQQT